MSTEASPLLPKHSQTPVGRTGESSSATGDSAAAPIPTTDGTEALEEEPDLRTPQEKRRSLYKWLAFWAILTGAVIFCVVEAIKEGGGQIDWKGALKKAGGGVSLVHECLPPCDRTLIRSLLRASPARSRWCCRCSR